jgi:predicted nucleic acid-binding protein
MIVADTNLVVHLLIEGEKSDAARAVWSKDSDWMLPTFWSSEFLNVLTTSVRHGVLTLRDAHAAWQLALTMFDDSEIQPAGDDVLDMAVERKLSAYDAQFAVAATDLEVPLVTSDRDLLKACPGLAIAPERFAGS